MRKAIERMKVMFYTVDDMLRMYQSNRIVIDNSFQRKYVWSRKNQINLIESILLGFPIPEFIFLEKPVNFERQLIVIDGQQRIGAITGFVNGEFTLEKKYLLDKVLKDKIGGLGYEQLNHEMRYSFLEYPLSFRLISSDFAENEIKTIFMRLNSNSLPLNPQELRNAVYDGEFLKLAEELADIEFWDNYRLFSNHERRRMQDIQFISSILLFFRMGIGEETTQENYNRIYDMYNNEYEERENDKELFEMLLHILEPFLESKKNLKFLRKKTHLYTLLIVAYNFYRKDKEFTKNHIDSFNKFVELYSLPKEEMSTYILTQRLVDINDYKNLSLRGTQKKMNRMKRVKTLERIIRNEY